MSTSVVGHAKLAYTIWSGAESTTIGCCRLGVSGGSEGTGIVDRLPSFVAGAQQFAIRRAVGLAAV